MNFDYISGENMIRKTLWIAVVATLAAGLPAHAQVAKVNGVTIPQARAEALIRELSRQGRQDSPELRNVVRQELINRELMSQAAMKLGLEKQSDVKAQLDIMRQNVLVGAFLNEMAKKHPATEDAIKAAHERFKDSPAANEYKAHHILVGSETEAKDLIGKIRAGEEFAKVASASSKDPGSKSKGGDLGWAAPASYVRPFAEALAKLKKGEMTDSPVQSNFGWHIIRLEDVRPIAYETLKPQLQQLVVRENVQKAIEELRTAAKVE
jgi:peptidyl-prolyl cis-trans isomerase C